MLRKLKKNTEVLWCFRCKGTRPARAHHCSKCRCCVEQMDHHCPWIQRCVGKGNRAHFIQFLLVAAFGLTIYLFDVFRFIYRIFVLNYSKLSFGKKLKNQRRES